MASRTIDLQDGFDGDDVIVRANGKEIARRSGVRTKRTIGLAQSLSIDVPDGNVTIEIEVPTRRLTGRTDLTRANLGVSISGGALHFVQSDDEFGYA